MGYQPSVRDIILAFFRRRTLFMLVCGAVFLAGGAYLLLKQPLYQSTASLVLHFDTQAVPNIDRTMNPTQPLGANEHREILYSDSEIMRSTGVIHGVIAAVGIARLYPQIAAGQASDTRKLDLATDTLLANLVVDVGLQSDALNINYFNPDPTVARDTVQTLLNKFFDQEAAVYANPQLTSAENEAYETSRVEANRNAQKISAAVVIAAPTVGQQPARPRRKRVALATFMAAVVLGCASVLAVEGLDDRFRTPRDVTRVLRLPVLATFA